MSESDLSSEVFSKLMFRTAFCLVACDGEIHEDEIEELRIINANTPYFKGIDLDAELKMLVGELKGQGAQTVHDLFSTLKNTKLSMVQELLLLEVAFRIVSADQNLDPNEIKFVKTLRLYLDVLDPLIFQRFGHIPYLVGEGYESFKERAQGAGEQTSWKVPSAEVLEEFNFSEFND